jgi:hypothetical protein
MGNNVFNHELKLIGQQITESKLQFTSIYIQSTRITHIDNNTFPDGKYDEINIANNEKLEFIDSQAFGGSVKNFRVINNPKLNQSIFAIMASLNISNTINLNKNSISEIPANAFKGLVSKIDLTENSIKKIGSNAFSSLTRLENLTLDYNLIDFLDNYSLNFSSNKLHKIIKLNNNNISSESFSDNFLPKLENNRINIHFEDNLIDSLPEKAFRQFLGENGHKIFLDRNPVKCDCDMKWIIDRPQSNHIFEVFCKEKQKSIFDLTPEEFECNKTKTTVTKLSSTTEKTTKSFN